MKTGLSVVKDEKRNGKREKEEGCLEATTTSPDEEKATIHLNWEKDEDQLA